MVSPSSPWNCSISSREQEVGSGRNSTAEKDAFAMASSAAGGVMTGGFALRQSRGGRASHGFCRRF